MAIANKQMSEYPFLAEMYRDDYFPNHLVDKGKAILIRLCERIEDENPRSLRALYKLTHAATEEFNQLASRFIDEGSEIETTARDAIGSDFSAIAQAYGFDADTEELISPRDW